MENQPDNWITDQLARAARNERAPERLRLRIDGLSPEDARARLRAQPSRRGEQLWRGRALGLSAGCAVVLAVLAVIVLVSLPVNPGVAQAAELGAKAPTLAAPGPAESGLTLRSGFGRLQFPNWSADEGYVAYGGRRDTLGNHTALTVYYRDDDDTVAYTIVGGTPLKDQRREPTFTSFRKNGRTVVSWQLDGHSCLLSSPDVSAADLEALAQSVYVAPARSA